MTLTEASQYSVSVVSLVISELVALATALPWMETQLILKLSELMASFRPIARLCLKLASEVLLCSHPCSPSSSSMCDLWLQPTPTKSYSCSLMEQFTICLLQSTWSVNWLNFPVPSLSWVSVTPTSQLWRNLMVTMADFVTHVANSAPAISSNSLSLTHQCEGETWQSRS